MLNLKPIVMALLAVLILLTNTAFAASDCMAPGQCLAPESCAICRSDAVPAKAPFCGQSCQPMAMDEPPLPGPALIVAGMQFEPGTPRLLSISIAPPLPPPR